MLYPQNEWSPETTEKKEGFVHPVHFEGIAERATLEFIIRDFDDEKLKESGERLKAIAEEVSQSLSKALPSNFISKNNIAI